MKPKNLLRIALGSLMVAAATAQAAGSSPDLGAQSKQDALKQVIFTCGTCHGTKGRSVSPTFPNLAGQSTQYMEIQLHAFKDQSRADPDAQAYMWGMASQLNDATITPLVKYFSGQPAAPGTPGNAAQVAQGKEIFEKGVPESQIPPCATCHGAHAEGNGPFPRLAGQHAPYLLKQLLVIQSVLRTAPVMHGVIKDLSKPQMQAVATYLQSL